MPLPSPVPHDASPANGAVILPFPKRIRSPQVESDASFHGVPPDPQCRHCTGDDRLGKDWSFVDGVYCISLRERDDRMRSAAAALHRVGLCRSALFYRPSRHPIHPVLGIAASHQAVARHALAAGASNILVLEDDVRFSRRIGPSTVARIARVMRGLPEGWKVFYLGHWPISARFLHRNLLKTKSGCAHAYIASHSMMEWLDRFRWDRDGVRDRWIGKGIDAAFAAMDDTYAYFPMIAIQAASVSDNRCHPARHKQIRTFAHLVKRTGIREVLLSSLMRPNEMVVAAGALVRSIWGTCRAPRKEALPLRR